MSFLGQIPKKSNLCRNVLGIFKTTVESTGSRYLYKADCLLYFYANDQRADPLECAGNTDIETPNVDELAKTGGRFSITVRHGRSSSCYLHPKPDNTDEWEKLVSYVRQSGRSNHHADAFCLKWL